MLRLPRLPRQEKHLTRDERPAGKIRESLGRWSLVENCRVGARTLDRGLRTRHRGNRVYQLDEQGERSTPLPDQDVSRDVPGS